MRGYAVVAGLAIGLAFAAVADSPVAISQKGRIFQPAKVEIHSGETLAIANDDGVLHHVYIESPSFNFDSGEQPSGKTVFVKFAKPGEYDVLCAIHPKMRLRVTVR